LLSLKVRSYYTQNLFQVSGGIVGNPQMFFVKKAVFLPTTIVQFFEFFGAGKKHTI